MNVKVKRVFSLVLMFALLVANLAAFPVLADNNGTPGNDNGDTGETEVLTDVVITKVETPDDPKDMTLEDLANGIDLEDWFSEGAMPLPGVSFYYFEVTAEQLAEMNDSPVDYDSVDKVEAYLGAEGVETEETDENGQVVLEGLAEGSYWIVEDTKGTIASSKAVPFGLTLPFTNLGGDGFLETIYVYPKNTLEDTPEIDKTVDESNVQIGALNTWTVSLDIPKGIEDYKKYGFTDEIDERLDFEGVDSVVVEAEGVDLEVYVDYTVVFDDTVTTGTVGSLDGKALSGKLTVMFTDAGREKLADATSDTVDVYFGTRVNEKAIMGLEIFNTASLEFDNGHGKVNDPEDPTTPEEEPEVHTGGKAFIKKDASNEDLLEGAEFVIQNEEGQYVKVSDDKKTVEFVDDEDDATTFVSDENGEFEIKGLPYGDYVLIETKAPEGFALPTDPTTDFVVDENSYYQDLTSVDNGNVESDNAQVLFNKKMSIPQTGGMGTLLFTLIGGLLIIAGVIFNRKTEEA